MLELRRRDGRLLRVGHRGAAALAPENTLRSLALAIELGVDLVEFDVLDLRDGGLVLAHSDDLFEVSHGVARGPVRARTLAELRRHAPELPTLDEALAFLGERAPGVGLHVDLKSEGYEQRVVEALRRHGALERALVSSSRPKVLRAVAALAPGLRLGLSFPEDRRGIARRRAARPFVPPALALLRAAVPLRIAAWLERARASAAMLHFAVVTPAAIKRCHARGAAVFVWTVDDPVVLARLDAAGVDGVITNDPRIFSE